MINLYKIILYKLHTREIEITDKMLKKTELLKPKLNVDELCIHYKTENNNLLEVKLNHKDAQLPTSGSAQSVGLDLYACEQIYLQPNWTRLVNTGISIKMPRGVYGRVAPRSGLSVKKSIMVNAGVIDADYRGDIKVCLHNLSSESFEVKVGDRIAQLILEKAIFPVNVKAVETLDETERGEGGFGSTGN